MLARSGVSMRTAQQLMRHSDIRLTASVYVDPALLDLQGAVEAIPLHLALHKRVEIVVQRSHPMTTRRSFPSHRKSVLDTKKPAFRRELGV